MTNFSDFLFNLQHQRPLSNAGLFDKHHFPTGSCHNSNKRTHRISRQISALARLLLAATFHFLSRRLLEDSRAALSRRLSMESLVERWCALKLNLMMK